MNISRKTLFLSYIFLCSLNEAVAMSSGQVVDFMVSELEQKIKDYAKEKAADELIKVAMKTKIIKERCEESFLLTSNLSVDNALRLFLQKYGIAFFPLQSFQRLKKSFAKCACSNPVSTIGSLTALNPEPLIIACFTPLLSALMTEIGSWGVWLWYCTKILGHKVIHTAKPVYNADLS